MTESSFKRFKEEVRSKCSLSEMVAKDCKNVSETSNGLLCSSPFRDDPKPSFTVFINARGDEVAHDFGTKETWDVFDYVQKRDGVEFAEAVHTVAATCGMDWDQWKHDHGMSSGGPAEKPEDVSEEDWAEIQYHVQLMDERFRVREVLTAITEVAHSCLLKTRPVYDLLKSKWGLTDDSIQQFQIGYIPEHFGEILVALREAGKFRWTDKDLSLCGAFWPPIEGHNPRCIFSDRIWYPYWSEGKVGYAIGRITKAALQKDGRPAPKFKKLRVHNDQKNQDVSEYINNNILFNQDNAAKSRSRFKRIIICEGPSDCMVLVQHGHDAIAPVTTSVKNSQMGQLAELVKRYKEVILATDTDISSDGRRPGLEGALRMAPALIDSGKPVKMLVFPLRTGQSKMDPAQWQVQWEEDGKTGDPFGEILDQAQDIAEAMVQFIEPDADEKSLVESMKQILGLLNTDDPLFATRRTRIIEAINKHVIGSPSKADLNSMAKTLIKQLEKDKAKEKKKHEKAESSKARETATEAAKQDPGGAAAPKTADEDDTASAQMPVFVARDGTYYRLEKKDVKQISSFGLQPIRSVINAAGEVMIECYVVVGNVLNANHTWTIPSAAWASKKHFKELFPYTSMSFYGSEDDIQYVRKLVHDQLEAMGNPSTTSTPLMGIHEIEGEIRMVLPGQTWDQSGAMESPDIVFDVTKQNSFSQSISLEYLKLPDGQQHDMDRLVSKTIDLIFRLNEPDRVALIFNWCLGRYFTNEIRELNGGRASHLNIFATPGSGKTTLIFRAMMPSLFGLNREFNPATPRDTQFATIRNMSWSNIFPAPFDEFRESEMNTSFPNVMRTAYSGGSQFRGRADQSLSTYELKNPAIICGEQRFDIDAAMSERLLMVGLDRTFVDNTDRSQVSRLLGVKDRWKVASDIATWRMGVDFATVSGWWKHAQQRTADSLKRLGALDANNRLRDICIEIIFCQLVFEAWGTRRAEHRTVPTNASRGITDDSLLRTAICDILDRPVDTTMFSSTQSKSLVVIALEHAEVLALGGELKEGIGWRYDSSGMLLIQPTVLQSEIAKDACKKRTVDPTNGLPALRRAAREEKKKNNGWFIDNGRVSKLVDSENVESKAAQRCWVIDVEKAAEAEGLSLRWPIRMPHMHARGTANHWSDGRGSYDD
jgi:DNA primase